MEKYSLQYAYPFSSLENKYIYDATTNSIVKISKSLYESLKSFSFSAESLQELEKIQSKGFLSETKVQKIEHPLTDILPELLKESVQGITLQVTQQCNLRCKYCVYSGEYESRGHSQKRMTIENAKRGVDFLMNRSSAQQLVNIGFYGGEPLLEFALIKKVVAYVKENFGAKQVLFTITTNGTLFNDEINAFLQKHDFNVLVSLDGPEEIHDRNRVFCSTGKGTFSTIMKNIEYIKEKYPILFKKIAFNAVLDPTLDPVCSNQFFIKSEFFSESDVSSSIINPDYKKNDIEIPDEYFIQKEKEMFLLLLNKVGRIENNKISKMSHALFEDIKARMVDMRKRSAGLPQTAHPSGPCVPGARKLFLSADGELYPCERVSESSANTCIGTLDDGFNLEQVSRLLNIGKLTEDNCKSCWGIRLCTQCVAVADDIDKLCKKKKLSHCKQVLNGIHEELVSHVTLLEHGYAFDSDLSPFTYSMEFAQ